MMLIRSDDNGAFLAFFSGGDNNRQLDFLRDPFLDLRILISGLITVCVCGIYVQM